MSTPGRLRLPLALLALGVAGVVAASDPPATESSEGLVYSVTLNDALRKVQSHDATHTSSISQAAAVEALNGPQDSVASMREEYRRRRDDLVRSLNGIRGIACTLPPGSFYVFPNVKGAMTALGCATSIEFARRLMTEIGVATVPGEAFGAPGYVRLSYALALDRIREGAGRLLRLLGRRDA